MKENFLNGADDKNLVEKAEKLTDREIQEMQLLYLAKINRSVQQINSVVQFLYYLTIIGIIITIIGVVATQA